MGDKSININLLLLPFEQEDYWIFRIDNFRNNFLIDNIIDINKEYSIQYEVKTIQKKDFRGKVIFFLFDEQLNDWTFKYQGNIKNFEYLTEESEKEEIKHIKITFVQVELLSKLRNLDELKHSLKCIKDINRPLNGIKNYLNRISKVEFNSIVFGEIYYTRTLFYKLFDSLQKDHKLAFYYKVFSESSNKSRIENNSKILLPLLLDYIESTIYKPAIMFVDSIKILQDLNQNTDISKIGFDSPNENRRIDYADIQFKNSEDFISSFNRIPRIDEIKEDYYNYESTENEFYEIFKSVPFPTNLL